MNTQGKRCPSFLAGWCGLLAIAGALSGQQADFCAINSQRGVTWGRAPANIPGQAKRLQAWTESGGFAYAVVYRFPAEAGSRYTLVLTYPSDNARRRVVITGENPYADDTNVVPQGKNTFYPLDLTVHPPPPGAAPCTETRRVNFAVDRESNARGLFLICLARETPAPLDFILKFPAANDAEVKAYADMPNCPWLGKIYWGRVVDFPIFMAGPKPPEPKAIAKDVRADIKSYGGTPIPEGGDFTVPAGFQAVNFRATNQVDFPNKAWRIVRVRPDGGYDEVYRFGINTKPRPGEPEVVEVPVPLKKLILGPDRYRVMISGGSGSFVHVHYELLPVQAGKG